VKETRTSAVADVARVAKVSRATVSNVLNHPEIVRPATIARVQAAMEELGFVPNRAASALRHGTSRLLGVVVPAVTNPFYAAIVAAIADEADALEYTIALAVSHDDPERELRHFLRIAEQRARGAIVIPLMADWSRLSELRRVGTHLILVDRAAASSDYCSVSMDDVGGGRLAVEHLLELKGKGITLVNGDLSIPQCQDRRDGARAALTAAGADPDSLVEISIGELSFDAGFEAGGRIAAEGAPRRIFCVNDLVAAGVISGLARAGIATPRDAVVVGYGDLELAHAGQPTLTSVRQPTSDMGVAAVDLLVAELDEGEGHRHRAVRFGPDLVVRESTGAAAL
jgi:LacI family transcriptional regulator